MASKPGERRCFIDYLPSLLLLWGLLFFQQDVAAQEPDLQVEIKPAQSCLQPDWNSPVAKCLSPVENNFCIRVQNKGVALSSKWEWIIWPLWGRSIEPIVTIKVDLPEGVMASNPPKSGNEIIFFETGDLENNGQIFKSVTLEGNIAGNIVATASYQYEDGSDFSDEGNDEIVVLSQPLPGSLGGNQTTCYNTRMTLGTEGENLFAAGAAKSFKWEWAPSKSENWKKIEGATEATYTPDPVLDTIRFRRTAVAAIHEGTADVLVCESNPEDTEIFVFPKICQVASNPTMRVRAFTPQEDGEE